MDKLPLMTSRAVNRAEKVNAAMATSMYAGDFRFDIEETKRRTNGDGVVAMRDTDFTFAVPCDLIAYETLALCNIVHGRSFKAGEAFGQWKKQFEICRALGVEPPEAGA